jgi:hypothetical protein
MQFLYAYLSKIPYDAQAKMEIWANNGAIMRGISVH